MLKEIFEIPQPKKYKINYNVFINTQRTVLQQLGLTNLNQLRDRFEGQKYLNSVLLKTYAYVSIQFALEKEIDNLDLNGNINTLRIKNEDLEIIVSDMDSYPMIPKSNLSSAILVFVNVSTRDTIIVGKASYDIIINNLNKIPISPVFEKYYYGYLDKFDMFSPLS